MVLATELSRYSARKVVEAVVLAAQIPENLLSTAVNVAQGIGRRRRNEKVALAVLIDAADVKEIPCLPPFVVDVCSCFSVQCTRYLGDIDIF